MTPFPALVTPFPKILVINKRAANNKRNPPSVSDTPFRKIPFTNEEVPGCLNIETIGTINEAGIGAMKAGRALPSCFFISCFTVPVVPQSISLYVFSSDFTILIISSLYSIKINKVNPFLALTAPRPLAFFTNLSTIGE